MTRPPLPRWLLGAAAVSLAFVALPLLGMAARLPWARVPELLATPQARDALALSLRTGAAATLLALVLGLPLALTLSRARGRWVAVARTIAVLPMVLPPVVAGLALLTTLGRRGVLGQHLAVLGIEIGFTTAAVVIAQTFVAMPYVVVGLEGAFQTVDGELEQAAATLGARPTTVLRRVTLPMVGPSTIGAATMAFARALGEFGATLTFAGSLQGTTRTLPLEIYLQREADTDVALALSLLLVVVAGGLMSFTTWLTRRGAPTHA